MTIVRIACRKKQWHTTDQRVLDDHRMPWTALGLHVFLCSRVLLTPILMLSHHHPMLMRDLSDMVAKPTNDS